MTLIAEDDVAWLGRIGEQDRVAFLRGLDVLDTEPEQHFDWLTARAADACGTPMALLSLVDEDRQWFKSRVGLDLTQTPRAWSFCQHTFDQTEPLVVPDTTLDTRFARTPAVTDLAVRSYAGVGIWVEGRPLGALCVLDRRPRVLTPGQLCELTALARQAELALELVHRRMEAQRNLRIAEDAASLIRTERRIFVEDAVDPILTSRHGIISHANAASHALFAPEDGVLVGRNILELVHPGDHRLANLAALVTEREGRDIGAVEYRVVTGSGRLVEVEARSTAVILEGHPATQTIIRDISDRREAERVRAALEHAVTHDETTGLLNRRSLHGRLDDLLATVPDDRCVGAVMLGVDDFGLLVESTVGDHRDGLLQEVAARVRSCAAPRDVVASFSGEQIVLCRSGIGSRAELEVLVDRLRTALAAPFVAGDSELFLRISMGVADSTDCDSSGQLLADAAAAMGQAREAGGDRQEWFDGTLRERATRRTRLASSLRHAIDADGLSVHYQPKVRLADGLVLGAEALVRWTSPELGPIAADELISVAEASGLIHALGRQVLERACRDAAEWQWARPEVWSTVAVNVSAQQLHEPEFPAVVAGALAASGLEPARLCLELTETSVMHDVAAATHVLRELKALGVTLAIDDFGTGYSSLAYLRDFPIDQIKVDRRFVRDVDRNPDDRHIVAAIVAVAAAMALDVVAEGVETAAQTKVLVALGCTVAQGHLWSPAVPLDALRELLGTTVRVPLPSSVTPSDGHHAPPDPSAPDGTAEDALALIDHELRDHLSVLGGCSDLLATAELDGCTAGPVVRRTARRMASTLDALDDVRSISSGSIRLERSRADLAALVAEAIADVTAGSRAAAVRLLPTAGRVLVDVDAARISQVVSNLVRNAVRFNVPGEAVTVRIEDGDEVRVVVSDRGPGVPDAGTGLIFRKFGRAHPGNGSNSGLGLYLARGIARAHGGDVRYAHRAGGGAQFTLHLPRLPQRPPGPGGRS